MKQGDIWYADLNPTEGNEQHGLRPVVIISGNVLNDNFSLVIIVPLTSRIKSFKGNPSIKASSKKRFRKRFRNAGIPYSIHFKNAID